MATSLLQALHRRQPGQPIRRVLWWHFLHLLCYFWFAPCYRFRAWGIHHIPDGGPVLFVSNHQSFLDPIVVGLAAHKRQFYALARSTLWHTPGLGWLISSLNAVPVERGESDIKAIRACLDMLQRGHALLVFPEGTRTRDGTTGPFETGTMLLIKRARPKVVPVALEGTFAVWPRGRLLPRLVGRVGVMYGQPVDADELLALGADAAVERLRQRVEAMRLELAQRLQRCSGRYNLPVCSRS